MFTEIELKDVFFFKTSILSAIFCQVKLDGVDLKDFNLGWLRSQIGVVSQDPVLFAATIEDNIR